MARPKGSRNKTSAFQRKIGEGGLTPLDYMLKVVRDDKQEQGERIKAAIAAAPYIHPRLSQIEQTVTHRRSAHDLSDAELAGYLESPSGEGVADPETSTAEPAIVH